MKYIKVKENTQGITDIKVDVFYDIGSDWAWDYHPRGYYMSAVPVKVEDKGGYVAETSSAYSGVRQLIKEVKRKSKKSELEAEEIAMQRQDIIDYVLSKNGLSI